jgi:hypothetical protein
LEEFVAMVSFKRSIEIEGYKSILINFTFEPYKLYQFRQPLMLYFENQDYCEPIPFELTGTCVDVPIYIEKLQYDMRIMCYEQTYREKIVLHNRSALPMKLQLFSPKDFKPYLEFNPTLGYI